MTAITVGQREVPVLSKRMSWAVLLARVFHFELSVCERCGGTVKVVAALTELGTIRKYQPGFGLPARAPPMAPAGRQPQQKFDIDYAASAAWGSNGRSQSDGPISSQRPGGRGSCAPSGRSAGASRRTRRLIFTIDAIDHTQPGSQGPLR